MTIESLSIKDAQRIIYRHQLLAGRNKSPLEVINHLGYVQIDTISVVERAHHHVFWSRFPQYNKQHLHDLVDSREVFEYWSHAAAYLPMREQNGQKFRFVFGKTRLKCLRHFEELSNNEVAEVLGIGVQAASKRYIRAMKRMKELVADLDG